MRIRTLADKKTSYTNVLDKIYDEAMKEEHRSIIPRKTIRKRTISSKRKLF